MNRQTPGHITPVNYIAGILLPRGYKSAEFAATKLKMNRKWTLMNTDKRNSARVAPPRVFFQSAFICIRLRLDQQPA